MIRTMRALIVAAGIVVLALAAQADSLSEARVKELVYEAIRENPDIIMEAIAALQQRETAGKAASASDVLASERALIERDPNAPVVGNPDGDVTVVEFFDYNCPYCRRAAPEVDAMIAADPNIRLVYREWPILGEGSVYAARAALAARKQGKYGEFHKAMMALKGRVGEAAVLRVAGDIGLDIDRLKTDMKAPEIDEHIATSMRLAQALGFQGTPAFVIGDALVPGFIEQTQLEDLVAKSRQSK